MAEFTIVPHEQTHKNKFALCPNMLTFLALQLFCHETCEIDFTCGKSRSLTVCKPVTYKMQVRCFNH